MGAFGEKLRKQREQRGIALDAISNTTKISTRMLRALEDEHFDQLPGGVFNKGFVRAYARQVGLDEEEAIADYLAALRESQIQAQAILPDFRDHTHTGKDLHGKDDGRDRSPQPAGDDRRKQGRRSQDSPNEARPNEARSDKARTKTKTKTKEDRRSEDLPPALRREHRVESAAVVNEKVYENQNDNASGSSLQIPWGKLAVGLLLITFALAIWNSRRRREPAATPPPAAASNPAPVTAPVLNATQPPAKPARKSSPTATSSSGKLPPGTSSAATTPPVTASASKALPATAGSANVSTTNPAANLPSVNTPEEEDAASTPAPNPANTFSLLIRAEKTTWVAITADGKPVAEETLIAPAHTSVRAGREIVVKAGNAAGVSFQLNGKEIPAQGNEGEVKTYVFDATGLRAQ